MTTAGYHQAVVFHAAGDRHKLEVAPGDVIVMASRGRPLKILELGPGRFDVDCPAGGDRFFPLVMIVLPRLCARLLAVMPTGADDLFEVFERTGVLRPPDAPLH